MKLERTSDSAKYKVKNGKLGVTIVVDRTGKKLNREFSVTGLTSGNYGFSFARSIDEKSLEDLKELVLFVTSHKDEAV